MFALLRQLIEDRRAYFQSEAKPIETEKSMNISKKFLEALTLSFEAKYLGEDVKPSKKENKVKAVEKRLTVLYNYIMDTSTNSKLDDIIALATAYHNIGQVYVASTKFEELNFAVVCFSKCLELLQEKHIILNPKSILTSISVLNDLNLVCDKVEKKRHTSKFLNAAMELYLKYIVNADYPDPVNIATIVDIKEEESNPRTMLDTLHQATLRDLGIQYLIKPKDKHRFVIYLHILIKDRLSQMISEERKFQENFNCFDVALTLFDLSKYFLANARFVEARNHIITADYLTCKFSDTFIKDTTERKDSKSQFSLYERLDYVCAVSARCWGTYGVSLLRFWVDKFLQNKKENSCEFDISKLKIKSEEEDSSKLLIFSNLEEELKQIANQITYTRILNLTDAKSTFVQTLRYLDKAKKYFTTDTDIDSYMEIVLEISAAYKYLAGFEQHRDKQIKLHKRRVECLEGLCEKFSITVKEDGESQLYKQILYELMTSCSTVIDLMLEEMYYNMSFKDVCAKVNHFTKLISISINYLKH
ncbi:KIF-binding protein [Monomorium pharaonis]|uniref:KIF-binding protein n=1 Tax=Monomorium pharaonis TaxID=307658 RepID=UPI00063FAA46|nr:KIF-binding protein [Monomorium pharaonis]XP_036139175.1 KIF-binding protein [Monomorium pharaonis]